MKATIRFGRFGEAYFCSTCKSLLDGPIKGVLTHPITKTVLFRERAIDCQYAGQNFRRPFDEIELQPVTVSGEPK